MPSDFQVSTEVHAVSHMDGGEEAGANPALPRSRNGNETPACHCPDGMGRRV